MMPSIVTHLRHSDTETGSEGMLRNVINKNRENPKNRILSYSFGSSTNYLLRASLTASLGTISSLKT